MRITVKHFLGGTELKKGDILELQVFYENARHTEQGRLVEIYDNGLVIDTSQKFRQGKKTFYYESICNIDILPPIGKIDECE